MECLIARFLFVKKFSIGGASFHIGGPVSTGNEKRKKKLEIRKLAEVLLETGVMILNIASRGYPCCAGV